LDIKKASSTGRAEEARKFVRLGARQATADASSAFTQYRHAKPYTATAVALAYEVVNEEAFIEDGTIPQ
jgi:hypothetical protein